jgi:hypothetical protein
VSARRLTLVVGLLGGKLMNRRSVIRFVLVLGLALVLSREGFSEDIPETVTRFHSIIVSENWDRPAELKLLIHFPLTVREVVYLSGQCDSKCSQFSVKDYESLRKVLAALHKSWTAKAQPGYEKYAPSTFAALSQNSYGVVIVGDCSHSNEVVMGRSSHRIESINVDSAGLAEEESLKKSIVGTCK